MWIQRTFWCTTLPSFDDRQLEKISDNNKIFGLILTDLSKAFDCIRHDLLVAKLHAHGLSYPALKMIQDYLVNRKQGTKIRSSNITWEKPLSMVRQGSILGPLLFNIFLCDLFMEHVIASLITQTILLVMWLQTIK